MRGRWLWRAGLLGFCLALYAWGAEPFTRVVGQWPAPAWLAVGLTPIMASLALSSNPQLWGLSLPVGVLAGVLDWTSSTGGVWFSGHLPSRPVALLMTFQVPLVQGVWIWFLHGPGALRFLAVLASTLCFFALVFSSPPSWWLDLLPQAGTMPHVDHDGLGRCAGWWYLTCSLALLLGVIAIRAVVEAEARSTGPAKPS